MRIFVHILSSSDDIMIYVTGDTHGEFKRFKNRLFGANEHDIVIICGDFGGIWDNSSTEKYWLKWLCDKPYRILFCDGNHENYDMINSYPVETLFGGKVHKITDNIYHLIRGEMFEIDGKKIFVMGGARSHDISDGILDPSDEDFKMKEKALIRRKKEYYRVKGVSWWEEEMPSDEEFSHALETFRKNNYSCDYIITHDCPSSVQKILIDNYIEEKKKAQYSCDRLNEFLQGISEKCEFKKWYFGHYHLDADISEKYRLLSEDIFEIGD